MSRERDREHEERMAALRRKGEKEDRLVALGARAGARARGDLERALAEPGSAFARGFRSELLRDVQHGESGIAPILEALGRQYGELLNAAERRVGIVWDERYAQGYRAGYERGVADGRDAAERDAA